MRLWSEHRIGDDFGLQRSKTADVCSESTNFGPTLTECELSSTKFWRTSMEIAVPTKLAPVSFKVVPTSTDFGTIACQPASWATCGWPNSTHPGTLIDQLAWE